jgi:hypothetical protein
MSRFRPIDRQTDYLLPPSVQEWLPEAHLARYVVDVVEAWTCRRWSGRMPAEEAMPTIPRCCCPC